MLSVVERFPNPIVFALALVCIELLPGQVHLAEHKMRGLKGVRDVALLTQPRVRDVEMLTPKDVSDLVKEGLHNYVPKLRTGKYEESSDWLVLSYITTPTASFMEIRLERWVSILGSGEKVVVPVWSAQQLIVGGFTREYFKETLDTLITSFAADYIRANP